MNVHVIPLKSGKFRAVRMTSARYARWRRAWDTWWDKAGCRLALSPEMWVKSGRELA